MATPLRYTLILLLWAIMAGVYLPLAPAAFSLITPALNTRHWLALFSDPQLPQALLATLVSVSLAAGGALIIALLAILALWPGAGWARLCTRLPWLLAIPYVAFAPACCWFLPKAVKSGNGFRSSAHSQTVTALGLA